MDRYLGAVSHRINWESESVSSLFLHSFNRRAVSGSDEDGADANV